MTTTFKAIKYSVLAIVAIASFIVVLGEESKSNPMPFGEFLMIKAIAFIVLVGCLQAFGALDVRNIFKEEEK